ncbi:MAG: hypothetical protein HY741_11680 [Chloroflexi bacterium]|nr:hypothetical protein [Chloroflexota bacterium]
MEKADKRITRAHPLLYPLAAGIFVFIIKGFVQLVKACMASKPSPMTRWELNGVAPLTYRWAENEHAAMQTPEQPVHDEKRIVEEGLSERGCLHRTPW